MPASHVNVKEGSSGVILRHAEARVVDGAYNDIPADEAGELLLRGPTVTSSAGTKTVLSMSKTG